MYKLYYEEDEKGSGFIYARDSNKKMHTVLMTLPKEIAQGVYYFQGEMVQEERQKKGKKEQDKKMSIPVAPVQELVRLLANKELGVATKGNHLAVQYAVGDEGCAESRLRHYGLGWNMTVLVEQLEGTMLWEWLQFADRAEQITVGLQKYWFGNGLHYILYWQSADKQSCGIVMDRYEHGGEQVEKIAELGADVVWLRKWTNTDRYIVEKLCNLAREIGLEAIRITLCEKNKKSLFFC